MKLRISSHYEKFMHVVFKQYFLMGFSTGLMVFYESLSFLIMGFGGLETPRRASL